MERAGCDIVVLSEFRANRAAGAFLKKIEAAGYKHSPASDPDRRHGRGVLIASRYPFGPASCPVPARLGRAPTLTASRCTACTSLRTQTQECYSLVKTSGWCNPSMFTSAVDAPHGAIKVSDAGAHNQSVEEFCFLQVTLNR